jgi:hypothetical protein
VDTPSDSSGKSVGVAGRRKWRRWTTLFAVASGVVIALLLLARVLAGPSGPRSDSLPSWSPDGGSITFSSNRDGYLDVFVVRADGSGVAQLTADPRTVS